MVLAGLLFSALYGAPYLKAALDPPPGTAFVGFFYYVDDHYNYLSYVEQAQRGAFLLQNKLVPGEHPGALVNLEWWLVGRLSAALGGHPLVAYRIFAVLAVVGFVFVLDLWLVRCGLPSSHRLPALLLIGTGGGLGGLLSAFAGWPVDRCLDIYAGLFPFLEMLANPHFTAGTALLLGALLAFETASSAAGIATAIALGMAVALVRPYDFVLLVAVRGLVVVFRHGPREWIGRLLPLAALTPTAAYLYWLFYVNPAFAFYKEAVYEIPPILDFAWAVGPGLLAVLLFPSKVRTPKEGRTRAHLLAWVGIALVVVAARPVNFSLQFLVGVGAPLLTLLALGLARFRPRVTLAMAAGLAISAGFALRLVLLPNPHWFVAEEHLTAVDRLARECGPRDLFLAPPEVGVLAGGLTPCRAFVSHAIGPRFPDRSELVRAFYVAWSPAQRTAFLDSEGITHLLLPGDEGTAPDAWLGPDTPFRRLALIGAPPRAVSVYARAASLSRAP